MNYTIHHGCCLETLRNIPNNSVDSIVADPPYGLSFMGKRWDYDVPSVEVWAECLRVLKPGGHLLAFAGTRTQHRMAVRIEDAGFEIRDMIAWVYGSGFPKSLDVSKAIDKQRTEDVEPVRVICRAVRAAMDAKGIKSRDLTQHFDQCHPRLVDHWAARDTDSQPSLPTWEQWRTLRDTLSLGDDHDAEVWRLNGRKGAPGDTWQSAEVIGEHKGTTPGFGEHRFNVRDTKIRAVSQTGSRWQGWGTALKPALEPITVARKPLTGTVAANVLEYGTGAINVDGCRVDGAPRTTHADGNRRTRNGGPTMNEGFAVGEYSSASGRWPANPIHDGSDEAVELFPNNNPGCKPHIVSASDTTARSNKEKGWGSVSVPKDKFAGFDDGDNKSAARFFYCAKANKKDRGEGNKHPTVKPTELMRYLCRLVTPPGGTVLDPFMGSGSTGKAAVLEGFSFIGIEREAEYVEIAKARISSVASPTVGTKQAELPLFSEIKY